MVKKRQTAAEYGAELEKDSEFVRRRQEQEARTQQYLNEMYKIIFAAHGTRDE